MKPTFIDALSRAESPWLHFCIADLSSITNVAFTLHRDFQARFVIRVLRGHKMQTVQNLFDEFAAALQFPYYFGENWNAFDECIKDLDWLPAPGYVIIILNSDQLLVAPENSAEQMPSLLKILESAGKEWSQAIREGAAWDRPGKPFHVIFQTENEKAEMFRLRLKETGLDVSDLSSDFGM